jgi:uncharacterized protein YecE (DUF72 family)
MEFGQCTDPEGIDFTLPPDPPINAGLPVVHDAGAHRVRIYLGATGYYMKPWVGTWYPATAKPSDYLIHYGHQFNTLEQNGTHYRLPAEEAVARWREETPADFRFCPKVLQAISHAPDLGASNTLLETLADALGALGDRYGCAFLQLPPTFAPHHYVRLERFLFRWPKSLPLAVEVRHPEFFPEAPDYFDMLAKHGATAVITDVAGRRDVCHMHRTTIRTMIRFVGTGRDTIDHQRLGEWADRLAQWCSSGLREVYFFTHQPDNLRAPDLAAVACAYFLKAMPEALIRGPKKMSDGSIQGRLF